MRLAAFGAKEAVVLAVPSRKNALGIRPGDFVLGGGVLLLAAASLLALRLLAVPGGRVEITGPEGTVSLSLSEEGRYPFTGQDGIQVLVEVQDGRVRFAESGCPDKVCVHTGWLSRAGQTAACLPAGILIKVEKADGDGVDAVAG